MLNLSQNDSSLMLMLFDETKIESYLISENALLLKFELERKNQNQMLDSDYENSRTNIEKKLAIAISLLKRNFIENLNINKIIITDAIPSYDSLLLQFDLEHIKGNSFKKTIENYIKKIGSYLQNNRLPNSISSTETKNNESIKTIKIPTYYGVEVGWDLHTLSLEKELSIDEIISAHSNNLYTVCAIGFSPGFAYMGFTPTNIRHKRLSNPRTNIFPGSVGIAEDQTGIYPSASPGGWNIIGRTPIKTIDITNIKSPSLFSIGDSVQFEPIDKKTYLKLGGEINSP